LARLRVTQFDAGPVQPRDLALAILHGAPIFGGSVNTTWK
jgi:hypothetical protein